ncbi:hypothetical protein CKA32_004600 [Geitlerinema sp. FC II]|nr:hypothetical protein CKA32_004600 [Geitlerinema sp. FC II]
MSQVAVKFKLSQTFTKVKWGASQFCKNISFGWQNSRLAFPV